MPQYAPDLTDYLAKIGEDKPTDALKDPELLQRALSKEAPIALVGKVAQALEDVDQHPAVTSLSEYERGRVMSALGRKQDSVTLYRQALESCTDPEARGQILVNLANDVDTPTEKEQLLRQAVEEGYNEALVHLGMFLDHNGHTKEALQLLLDSVRKGVGLGIPTIGQIYYKTKRGQELKTALAEVLALAQEAGIEDAANAPFDQFDSQALARSKMTNRFPNLLAISRPIRQAIGRMLDWKEAEAR